MPKKNRTKLGLEVTSDKQLKNTLAKVLKLFPNDKKLKSVQEALKNEKRNK